SVCSCDSAHLALSRLIYEPKPLSFCMFDKASRLTPRQALPLNILIPNVEALERLAHATSNNSTSQASPLQVRVRRADFQFNLIGSAPLQASPKLNFNFQSGLL